MSLFSAWLETLRQRGFPEDARLYYDAPVTIGRSELDHIADILGRTTSDDLTLYVNRKPIRVPRGFGYTPRIIDLVRAEYGWDEVKSISITNGTVTVYFARAASATSTSSLPQHLGSLWSVRRVLDDARWRAGTLLFRYWFAFVALVGVFVLSVSSASEPPAIVIWSALGGLALTLLLAFGVGVGRRVRLDVRKTEEKARGRVLDTFLSGLIYPALLLLIGAVITPLAQKLVVP